MTHATDFERLLDAYHDAVNEWSFDDITDEELAVARAAVIAAYNELAAECQEQARLNGMGSEREARLQARLAECEAKAAPPVQPE